MSSYKTKQVYWFYVYSLLCKLSGMGCIPPFPLEAASVQDTSVAADTDPGIPCGRGRGGRHILVDKPSWWAGNSHSVLPQKECGPRCATLGNAGRGKLSLLGSPTSAKKTLLSHRAFPWVTLCMCEPKRIELHSNWGSRT